MCPEDRNLINEPVEAIMQEPFPFVEAAAALEDVSKCITKECNAVLVKDEAGNDHIITRHDIIEAIK